MAKGAIAQYIEDVMQLVDTKVSDLQDGLDEAFKGEPYGATRPTKEETAGFVQMVLKREPPDWWVFPDGHRELNSGWLIAVREGVVEGGKQAWRQIEPALAAEMGGRGNGRS